MPTHCAKHWFRFVLLALAGIAAAGLIVMLLWNWLAPALFGWPEIHFLQALGLLVLTRLLFGGLRGRHRPDSHWRRRMEARCNAMTPEEREQFRTGMHCGWKRDRSGEQAAGD
ncbi:MAG: hypothetical protein P8076_05470 [Gammaproteobacteria bacterium]